MQVGLAGANVVEALRGSTAAPATTGHAGWKGPVFLPTKSGRTARLFFAHVEGQTEVFPFVAEDTLRLRPTPGVAVLEALAQSGFAGREWSIRPDARHAKSHTYARAELPRLV